MRKCAQYPMLLICFIVIIINNIIPFWGFHSFIIFRFEAFVIDIGEVSEERPLSQPLWIGELVPFLCSLIIKVKNAHVAEQLHRPGLFNRFLVNYISSWIPSRSLMMIFLKVTSFNSLEKFIAVSGGCDFILIKLSFVHRLFSYGWISFRFEDLDL